MKSKPTVKRRRLKSQRPGMPHLSRKAESVYPSTLISALGSTLLCSMWFQNGRSEETREVHLLFVPNQLVKRGS